MGKLAPIALRISEKSFTIKHELIFLMMDGAVGRAATHVASGGMNKLDDAALRAVSPEALRFGLSSLRARIRSMECLVHIEFKLPCGRTWCTGSTLFKI